MRIFALVSPADYTLRASRRNSFTRLTLVGSACRLLPLAVKVLEMKLKIGLAGLLLIACGALAPAQRRPNPDSGGNERILTVVTEPNVIVWIDEIRRGTTDAGGTLAQVKVSAGGHTLRARA